MSTFSSANVTDGNLLLKERTHTINNKIQLGLYILGVPPNKLGNWLMQVTRRSVTREEVHGSCRRWSVCSNSTAPHWSSRSCLLSSTKSSRMSSSHAQMYVTRARAQNRSRASSALSPNSSTSSRKSSRSLIVEITPKTTAIFTEYFP